MTVELYRMDQSSAGTVGRITVDGEFVCYSVEKPWHLNERNISCIPCGDYDLVWRVSPRFGNRLHVDDVWNRSHILIHPGNWQHETRGCIMPATYVGQVESGENAGCCGRDSRVATEKLERILKGANHTLIISAPKDYAGLQT